MRSIITITPPPIIHHANENAAAADGCLSDLGKEMAERIGKRISEETKDDRFVMYSADSLLARHTAEIVAEFMGIEPEFCGALGAFDLGGAAAGKPREWWQKNLKWRLETIDDRPIDGAESQRDVWNRLLPFYEKIINRADKNIIIVSHCDTLSVFYTMWLGLDVGTLNKCCLYGTPGGVSVMREDRCGKRIISSMNDLSYINS